MEPRSLLEIIAGQKNVFTIKYCDEGECMIEKIHVVLCKETWETVDRNKKRIVLISYGIHEHH
jgi:hypothetical protein